MSAQVVIERIASERPEAGPGDSLRLVWITGGTPAERAALGRSSESVVAAVPGAPDAWIARYEDEALIVEWRPGCAVVLSPGDPAGEVRAALIDFAVQEQALRELEAALPGFEAGAEADVARAYGIRFRDRRHWRGWQARIEACTRLRLAFVRLRPGLERAPPGLPAAGKRLAARLRRQARVADRLEGFSERLEAMEDLYEGAHDRVSDYRWFLHGQMLEIGIIVLLLAEVVLMALELHARLHGRLPS